jgi:hypothetical protein
MHLHVCISFIIVHGVYVTFCFIKVVILCVTSIFYCCIETYMSYMIEKHEKPGS